MQHGTKRDGGLRRAFRSVAGQARAGLRHRRLCCEALEGRRLLAAGVAYPTIYDQYLLELINRGRANPSAEASRYKTALNEGLPAGTISSGAKQPLAFNVNLGSSASGHSQWMLNTDTFSHTGAGGTDPGDRMAHAGYASPSTFGWAENIAWTGSTPNVLPLASTTESLHRALYVDSGVSGRGHRVNLMSPELKEVGIAVRTGKFLAYNAVMITEDFGYRRGDSFLTGVAYDDHRVSNNNFYTPGEGLGGVSVTATRISDGAVFATTTWASGGYSLRLGAGTYRVTASGGSLDGMVTVSNVTIGASNVKVDFTADMAPANRAPSFVKGANQTVLEGAGLQTIANWATQISPGPASEAAQAVRFLVTNNNRALFSSQPAISPDGTLTFTPKSGVAGTAAVTVRARDNGGTAHGGKDTSAAQTFVIKVAWNSRPVVQTPDSGGASNVVVRRSGKNLQIVDSQTRRILRQQPLASLKMLSIAGAADQSDQVSVDFRSGGTFSLPEGIVVDGAGGTPADTLLVRGSAGVDKFTAAEGRATIGGLPLAFDDIEQLIFDGGTGNDHYQMSALTTKTAIVDTRGTDTLDFAKAAAGISMDLNRKSGQAQHVFASNGNTLALKGTFEQLVGSSFADWIKGNSANNRIDGQGGNDTVYGGPGNDVLYGGEGDDWLFGEAGNDTLYGGAGNNVLLGGAGNDTLDVNVAATVGAGWNLLIAGHGADSIRGGNGEEILIGGATKYDNNIAALALVLKEWTGLLQS